jgi:hypothetical protein
MNVSYYERSSNLVYILTDEPNYHTALQLRPVDGNEQADVYLDTFLTREPLAHKAPSCLPCTPANYCTAANWGKVTRLTIRLLHHLKIGTFFIPCTCIPPHIAIVHVVMVLACMQGTWQAPGKRLYIDASHCRNIYF